MSMATLFYAFFKVRVMIIWFFIKTNLHWSVCYWSICPAMVGIRRNDKYPSPPTHSLFSFWLYPLFGDNSALLCSQEKGNLFSGLLKKIPKAQGDSQVKVTPPWDTPAMSVSYTFTLRVFSWRFNPKRFTIRTFFRRRRKTTIYISVQSGSS